MTIVLKVCLAHAVCLAVLSLPLAPLIMLGAYEYWLIAMLIAAFPYIVGISANIDRAPNTRKRIIRAGVVTSILYVIIAIAWRYRDTAPLSGYLMLAAMCVAMIVQAPLLGAAALAISYRFTRGPDIEPGHCQRCGYDLTGNMSGICPECGERVG